MNVVLLCKIFQGFYDQLHCNSAVASCAPNLWAWELRNGDECDGLWGDFSIGMHWYPTAAYWGLGDCFAQPEATRWSAGTGCALVRMTWNILDFFCLYHCLSPNCLWFSHCVWSWNFVEDEGVHLATGCACRQMWLLWILLSAPSLSRRLQR